MMLGHFSSIVSAVAAGCLCLPSELKQMSAETPALAQPPPLLTASQGLGFTALPQNIYHSAPWYAIVLSTATDLRTHSEIFTHLSVA